MTFRNTAKDSGRRTQTSTSRCTLRDFDDDHNMMEIKTADVYTSDSPTGVERWQQAGMSVFPMPQDEEQQQQGQQQQDSGGAGAGGGGGGTDQNPWNTNQPKGESAEGVMLYLNGSRSHPVCVSVDDRRCRPHGMKKGESFFYSVDHKNAQYGTYLRRRQDGKDGVYIIALDTKNEQQSGGQSGGGGGASAGTLAAGGGGGGEKEDRISIAHVEKEKQERKKGKQQQQGGGAGAGGQTGQQSSGGQQQYVHEGKSVNTEVRLTKKRIQFFKKSGGGAGAQATTQADSGGGGGSGGSRQDGELRGYWDNETTNWWWKADKNIENETGQDYKIKADGKTHFTASEHVRIGDLNRQGNEYLSGIDVAADHIAGSAGPAGKISGVSLLDVGARVAALEAAGNGDGGERSKLNKLADIFIIDDAGNVTVTGNLQITGNLTVGGVITARDFVRST
jgi:hypothetical protein